MTAALAFSPVALPLARRMAAPALTPFTPKIGYTGGIMGHDQDTPDDDRHAPEFAERVRRGDAAKMVIVPEYQLQEIADRAIHSGGPKILKEMWRQLGVNVDDAESVMRFTRALIAMMDYSDDQQAKKKEVRSTVMDVIMSAIKWIGAVAGLYVGHLIYNDLHK